MVIGGLDNILNRESPSFRY